MSMKDDIRRASAQFYAGLNSMANGNAGPLTEIWAHNATVSTMHPIGGREIGWEAVRGSFGQVAHLASDGKIELKDQLIQGAGDLAYETGTERGLIRLAGREVAFEIRVTNIYRHEAGKWRIVHHHSDTAPAMMEALKQAQAEAAQARK